MKDWKTYAIIILAVWCFANTDWECETCGTPAAAPVPVLPVVTQTVVVVETPAPQELEAKDPAPVVETVISEVSEADSEADREYCRFKRDQHLKYLKVVKASRVSWVAGNHDHKGFDYKIFLEQYAELKDYPALLKSRLDALRAEDARLSELVADDIRKYEGAVE